MISSRRSPHDPKASWPVGKAKLAIYHGLDLAGSINAQVSTLKMDRWLGVKVPLGLGFLGQDSWNGLDTVAQSIAGYAGIRENVIVSMPLCMSGSTLAQVAAGNFDSYYDAVYVKIAAIFPAAIIRIGWEQTGDWYPWAARNVEPDYIAAFRRVVDRGRLASGSFSYLWNPDKKAGRYAKSTYANPDDCYPGNDHVDFIGIDAYNGWVNGVNAPTKNANGTGGAVAEGDFPYPAHTQEKRWNNELIGNLGSTLSGTSKPYCLAWCSAFAADKGKRIIIPEWGTGFDSSRAGENCGDDGYYVSQMGDWIAANNVYAHGYWNRLSPAHYNARLTEDAAVTGNSQDDKPASKAAFLRHFGRAS